jgi:hypothetical protein
LGTGSARGGAVGFREWVFRVFCAVYFAAALVLGIIISADLVRSYLP